MKNIRKIILVFTLVIALLTSSCGVFDSGTSKDSSKDIESVITDFLDSVVEGDFADDNYKSSLISDKGFAKLKFEDEAAKELMNLAFGKIEYEIGRIKGSEEDEEGTCKITLTAIDLDSILEDMGNGYEPEDLEDEISAKKTPTEEHDITFSLEFDGEEWIISDLSDLVDAIGKPYTEIKFAEPEPTVTEPKPPETPPVVTTGQTTVEQIYTADEVIANLVEYGWTDPSKTEYVEGYTTADTQITFVYYFNEPMPGLRLNMEYFNNNGTTSLYSCSFDFEADDYSYYVYYTYTVSLPADTYRYVVSMTDGTVVIDESTTVT
jgi:hypothetical protein